jgi:hypothetical protein
MNDNALYSGQCAQRVQYLSQRDKYISSLTSSFVGRQSTEFQNCKSKIGVRQIEANAITPRNEYGTPHQEYLVEDMHDVASSQDNVAHMSGHCPARRSYSLRCLVSAAAAMMMCDPALAFATCGLEATTAMVSTPHAPMPSYVGAPLNLCMSANKCGGSQGLVTPVKAVKATFLSERLRQVVKKVKDFGRPWMIDMLFATQGIVRGEAEHAALQKAKMMQEAAAVCSNIMTLQSLMTKKQLLDFHLKTALPFDASLKVIQSESIRPSMPENECVVQVAMNAYAITDPVPNCRRFNRASFSKFRRGSAGAPKIRKATTLEEQLADVPLTLLDTGGPLPFGVLHAPLSTNDAPEQAQAAHQAPTR